MVHATTTKRSSRACMVAILTAGLVLGVTPLWASPPGIRALAKLARAVDVEEVEPDSWPFEEMDAHLQRATAAAVMEKATGRALAELRSSAHLDDATARAVLWSALAVLFDPFPEDCDELPVPDDVESALFEALTGAPPGPSVLSATAQLADSREWCPFGRRLVAALRENRAATVALELADRLDEYSLLRRPLLDITFAVEGASPRALVGLASQVGPLARAAALDLVVDARVQAGDDIAPDLDRDLLFALLDSGLADRAVDLWLARHPETMGDEGDVEISRHLDVAAAALIRHDTALARRALEAVDRQPSDVGAPPSSADESYEGRERARLATIESNLRWALELALTERADDPFEILAELALSVARLDGLPSSRTTLLRFLSDLSERQGFDSLAEYFAHRADTVSTIARNALARGDWEHIPPLEERVRDLLAVGEAGTPLEAAIASAGDASSHSLVSSQGGLERVPSGYRVRSLPAADLARSRRRGGSARPATRIPAGFQILRRGWHDGVEVVIASCQAIDPVGEVSTGGYWVLRTEDQGDTWRAFPTGLRVGAPYEVVVDSMIPLFDRDHVSLEVRWAEIDEDSISFPPVALHVERRGTPLVVEMPWEDLESDRDGDGLTDLLEARLLTDADVVDSDGDGLTDAEDPLPGIPSTPERSPIADAMEALLDSLGDEEQTAILPTCPDGSGMCFGKSSPGLERVLFVVGDPAAWSGLTPVRTTVVMTPEQHRVLEETWGPIYATSYRVFQLDDRGTRAVVVWDRVWQGGAAMLYKTPDGWRVEIRSSWIT